VSLGIVRLADTGITSECPVILREPTPSANLFLQAENFNVFVFLLLMEGSVGILYSVTEDIKRMSKPSDLVQGTLDMLLLKVLALEPMNGFAVSQRLKQVSGDILQMSDGSLYPALHKLEQEGWITAEWKTSEYGRRAKYYSLTRLGRRQLEKETDNWGRLSTAISRVVKLKEA
jgi:PadR family transcriptional regulator PadR